jgi:hypothetical protein
MNNARKVLVGISFSLALVVHFVSWFSIETIHIVDSRETLFQSNPSCESLEFQYFYQTNLTFYCEPQFVHECKNQSLFPFALVMIMIVMMIPMTYYTKKMGQPFPSRPFFLMIPFLVSLLYFVIQLMYMSWTSLDRLCSPVSQTVPQTKLQGCMLSYKVSLFENQSCTGVAPFSFDQLMIDYEPTGVLRLWLLEHQKKSTFVLLACVLLQLFIGLFSLVSSFLFD